MTRKRLTIGFVAVLFRVLVTARNRPAYACTTRPLRNPPPRLPGSRFLSDFGPLPRVLRLSL